MGVIVQTFSEKYTDDLRKSWVYFFKNFLKNYTHDLRKSRSAIFQKISEKLHP